MHLNMCVRHVIIRSRYVIEANGLRVHGGHDPCRRLWYRNYTDHVKSLMEDNPNEDIDLQWFIYEVDIGSHNPYSLFCG